MGFYVNLSVMFTCDSNSGVAALAREHAERLSATEDADGVREAKWYLDELGQRTGGNFGPKGGMSVWGMVGNYTQPEVFCETLRPFWNDLLTRGVRGGPLGFYHVLVVSEPEAGGPLVVYEIFLDGDRYGPNPPTNVTIKPHECAFSLGQSN